MSSNLALNPGLNSFKDFFIDSNGVFRNVVYYVDKTRFIEKAYNHNAIVTLFTKPRRFGKSMFLSMLKTFFEPNHHNPNDLTIHEKIFSQLEIYKNHEFCEKNMGNHPLLFISFASLGSTKGYNYSLSFLAKAIRMCTEQYEFLLDSNKLSEINKLKFKELLDLDSLELSPENLESKVNDALLCLCKFLYKHYGKKVIVLIDEYDVPLAFAAKTNYYESFKELISNMFEKLLKGNEQLDKAFLIGCLNIPNENIFTGFNNFKVIDYDNVNFSSLFGFTENEIKEILKNFNLEEHFEEYKAWYDGYLFGNDKIYCPWDPKSRILCTQILKLI